LILNDFHDVTIGIDNVEIQIADAALVDSIWHLNSPRFQIDAQAFG